MKTFQQFLEESNRRSQRAHKSGTQSKPGIKSGKTNPLKDKDVKMIGIPGSGKSTMASRLAKATGGTRYGYDDARKR